MSKAKGLWRRILPLIIVAACVPLVLMLLSGFLSDRSDAESLSLVEQSIRRAAVQCYALEGFYPPSLDYLVTHYGVSPDTRVYFVDYQYIASNLLPDITVLSLSK